MAECSPKGKKRLREKEKLLVTSNFSFSLSVFKRLTLESCKNHGLFGKGLTLSVPDINLTSFNDSIIRPTKVPQRILSHRFDLTRGQHRCKIRLLVLCSLILIYAVCNSP